MAEQNLRKTVVAIRDQIGSLDSVNPVGVWDYDEELGIEEGPTMIRKRDIGTAWVWGHPDNCIWGTTEWGEGTLGSWVLQRVVNPDNVFHEHFRDNTYEDTSGTATFDISNYRWEFTINDIAKTNSIFYNQQAISSVKINARIEGISIISQIDTINFPGGRDITLT